MFHIPIKREFLLLTVKRNVPYINMDDQLEKLTRADRLKLAGIELRGNRLFLDLEMSTLYGMPHSSITQSSSTVGADDDGPLCGICGGEESDDF